MTNVIEWWSRIHDRHRARDRKNDAIATQLYEEMQPVEDPYAANSLLRDALAEQVPPSKEELRALVDVLVHLPPRQRAVLEMLGNDWTPQEVAAALGVTYKVVKREHLLAIGTLRDKGVLW